MLWWNLVGIWLFGRCILEVACSLCFLCIQVALQGAFELLLLLPLHETFSALHVCRHDGLDCCQYQIQEAFRLRFLRLRPLHDSNLFCLCLCYPFIGWWHGSCLGLGNFLRNGWVFFCGGRALIEQGHNFLEARVTCRGPDLWFSRRPCRSRCGRSGRRWSRRGSFGGLRQD